MTHTYATRQAMARDGRQALAAAFPQVFPRHGVKRPIKLGIHHDIVRALPELSKPILRAGLNDFCEGRYYLRALVEGAPRIGLDGEPDGLVTAADEGRAKKQLVDLEEKWLSKRKRRAADEAASAAAQVETPVEEGARGRATEAGD